MKTEHEPACPAHAASLARLEAEIAIGTLLARLRGVRLAVDPSALCWRVGPLVRGLATLPLVFEPVS
jgi:cytochrome P450